MEIEPLEIARQLTLIEFNLFKKIIPKECLNQVTFIFIYFFT